MTQSEQFTFYGGGHRGTEAEFGQQAEQFGINEINFSFEGHQPARDKGLKILSPEELKKGDVSMEIVSMRMNRKYSQTNKIRKVFQSIFHMVNSGLQVFAVGWIQEDDTVKGGTGWAVELGKLFNRPLSVFDQARNRTQDPATRRLRHFRPRSAVEGAIGGQPKFIWVPNAFDRSTGTWNRIHKEDWTGIVWRGGTPPFVRLLRTGQPIPWPPVGMLNL